MSMIFKVSFFGREDSGGSPLIQYKKEKSSRALLSTKNHLILTLKKQKTLPLPSSHPSS